MKILIKTPSEALLEERCYLGFLRIEVDGEKVFSVHDGESEDNSLGRNFSDCFNIASLMRKAFEAGVNGEVLEIEEIEVDD